MLGKLKIYLLKLGVNMIRFFYGGWREPEPKCEIEKWSKEPEHAGDLGALV